MVTAEPSREPISRASPQKQEAALRNESGCAIAPGLTPVRRQKGDCGAFPARVVAGVVADLVAAWDELRASFIARHHTLPGGDASSGLRTPRCACQRMNDNAARRNGRAA